MHQKDNVHINNQTLYTYHLNFSRTTTKNDLCNARMKGNPLLKIGFIMGFIPTLRSKGNPLLKMERRYCSIRPVPKKVFLGAGYAITRHCK